MSFVLDIHDPEEAPLQLTLGEPGHGTVTNFDQSITYLPAANFAGEDAFPVTVSDGLTATTATIHVRVTPVDDAPVATDDVLETFEDTPITFSAADLLANDVDVDGDPLVITSMEQPLAGSMAFAGTAWTYEPERDYYGNERFTYTISDGKTASTAEVTMFVGSTDDAPIAVDDAVTAREGTPLAIPIADLLANDHDIDSSQLVLTNVTRPGRGATAIVGDHVVYTPALQFIGTTRFDYVVSDGIIADRARVTVTVIPANGAPTALPGRVSTLENTPVTLLLAGADPDGDPVSFSITVPPARGQLGPITQQSATTATVTYTPDAGVSGPDSFTFRVSDGTRSSAPAPIAIVVVPFVPS